jgi:hypothetical protein
MRTLIITAAVGLAAVAPATAAEAREPVTRAEVSGAAHRLADQSATELENHSAAAIEGLTSGTVSIDHSRTSVGNYLRYGKFRVGASFALFGTNTVNGVASTLLCIGNLEVVHRKNGRVGITENLTCPIS